MEQKSNNMAVQIGNIIANALIKRERVNLPSIGSLYVDSIPSKLKSSNAIIPPRYVVKFSSDQLGTSLIDIIAQKGGCELSIAEGIYTKWIEGARRQNGVEIEGVGVLRDKKFTPSSRLDSTLNPELHSEFKLKRRRGGVVWIAISVVVCVVVGVCVNSVINSILSSPKIEVTEVTKPIVKPEVIAEPEVKVSQEEKVAAPQKVENPRYRLVYGVFSTIENAQKAVLEVSQKSQSVVANIRPYGKMFMVNVLESDSVAECKDFIEQNRDIFPELWISKRRGE